MSWNNYEQFNIGNQRQPPLLPPPVGMMHFAGPEWTPAQTTNPNAPGHFIGPIPPENDSMDLTQDDEVADDPNLGDTGNGNQENSANQDDQRSRNAGGANERYRWTKNRDRENKDTGRQHDKSDRDHSRRPRSQDRDRRNDRSRGYRRVSRFSNREKTLMPGMPGFGSDMPPLPPGPATNLMMPGMLPFGNPMMPGQPPMDMHNMSMPNMPNMPNMPGNMLPGMPGNMLTGMPMMRNMMPGMDPSMMMGQQMQMIPQPIYTQAGVLLIPLPGASLPSRRERPPGCRTIFVGGLPPGIGLETINEIFQRFGPIDDVKMHKQGVCHIRFMKQETVEHSFTLSGFRFKAHDQNENEATSLFIDYALNRDDQTDMDRQKREPTPPRIEPFTPAALTAIVDKIKSDTDFAEAAPTLAGWLEKGECNKKNANTFYSLIQASNNQMRRLYNDKMAVDDELLNMKTALKEKFTHIISQFEQVAKILSAAKHKRASDHFSKQQRRNIEMWLKMTEDLQNIKDEFNMLFDDEETEKIGQKLVSADKYEQLKIEHEALICEMDGYRNEAHLAKGEAERKFEKFKAQFIAQQALHGTVRPQGGIFPPLPPPPPMPMADHGQRVPPTPDEMNFLNQGSKHEAKLVAMLTSFLLAHPLGATIDYLASYIRSMVPGVTQHAVSGVLTKYAEIFSKSHSDRWTFVLFDIVKQEGR